MRKIYVPNKREAMNERWRVKVKVEARLTSRLTLTRMRESKHRVYGKQQT